MHVLGNGVVEAGPELGVVVEPALGADVQLTAVEQGEIRVLLLQGSDSVAVLEELLALLEPAETVGSRGVGVAVLMRAPPFSSYA